MTVTNRNHHKLYIDIYLPVGHGLLPDGNNIDREASIALLADMVRDTVYTEYPEANLAMLVDADGQASDWAVRAYLKGHMFYEDFSHTVMVPVQLKSESERLHTLIEDVYRCGEWTMPFQLPRPQCRFERSRRLSRELSNERRALALKLKRQGRPQKQIAEIFGVTPSAVSQWLKPFRS